MSKVLAAGGRAGHYGLRGMRERAELIGAKLIALERAGFRHARSSSSSRPRAPTPKLRPRAPVG